jgi:hypothetical protein
MKLPAVAIAVPFASGIALGLHPSVARHAPSRFFALSLLAGVHILQNGRNAAGNLCFGECLKGKNGAGTSVRTEIPNQKQDSEKK